MLQGVSSLQVAATLKSIEVGGYNLDSVLRIVDQPANAGEFLIAEVAQTEDFWLAIDAKFCRGDLKTVRLDLSPQKWRPYVENYSRKIAYIYPIRRNWGLRHLTFHGEMSIGIRDVTCSAIIRDLVWDAPDDMNDGIDYTAAEIHGLDATPGCFGFLLEMQYYVNAAPGDRILSRTILFDKERVNESYETIVRWAAIELFEMSRRHLDLTVPRHHTGFNFDGFIVPSTLEVPELHRRVLNAFVEENDLDVGIHRFTDDGEMRFRQRNITINGLFNGKNIELLAYITISQLQF